MPSNRNPFLEARPEARPRTTAAPARPAPLAPTPVPAADPAPPPAPTGRRRGAWRGRVLPSFAVGALLFAAASVYLLQPHRPATVPLSPPPVPPANAQDLVAGVGLVEANTENVALSVPVPGWVTAVFVRAGDHVRTGQALFQLDDRDLRAALDTRRAQLALSQANVRTVQTDVDNAELLRAEAERLSLQRVTSAEDLKLKRIAAQSAQARLAAAQAQVALDEAQLRQAQTDLARLVVAAPFDGTVLQSQVRVGQYAPTGVLTTPLMLLGNVEPLHVRVDVDEQDAWRVPAGAPAVAHLRGDSREPVALEFVRFEPYVIPKKSLTGDSTERTDVRVLQVIYRAPAGGGGPRLFVGQQMDVFIQTPTPLLPRRPAP